MSDFEHRYDDIIGLPHPDPQRHPRMAALDRAAQFAPFAALTGFGAAIEKAARQHLDEQPSMYAPGEEFP
ncbi:MAG: hypothetical protein IJK55_07550 [Bacteroidales bacterium]|nr:hypothetical protein [Bacteroidales bacterium]MBR4585769.1 hypothetical protein [Bacteroidales bacterium]